MNQEISHVVEALHRNTQMCGRGNIVCVLLKYYLHKGKNLKLRDYALLLESIIASESPNWEDSKMEKKLDKIKKVLTRPRQDSNLQSSDPKSDALSIRPRGRHNVQCFSFVINQSQMKILTAY